MAWDVHYKNITLVGEEQWKKECKSETATAISASRMRPGRYFSRHVLEVKSTGLASTGLNAENEKEKVTMDWTMREEWCHLLGWIL